ncbi:endonuclease [Pseudoalteromonas phage J2-1_QLiu-2017]|nr:endonuclease [Pseudoalteromonas phage J2-1_QLiu-2017]
MNTKAIGIIVEQTFVLKCVNLGLTVSQPIGDNAPYDFVVELEGKLIKVQCKSMYKVDGAYVLATHRKTGHRRTVKKAYEDEVDLFFGYNIEDDEYVLLHREDATKTAMQFRPNDFETKTPHRVNYVKDYQSFFSNKP